MVPCGLKKERLTFDLGQMGFRKAQRLPGARLGWAMSNASCQFGCTSRLSPHLAQIIRARNHDNSVSPV